jgi:hypothetical protein
MLARAVAVAVIVHAEVADARAGVSDVVATRLVVLVGAAVEPQRLVVDQPRAGHVGAGIRAVAGAQRLGVMPLLRLARFAAGEIFRIEGAGAGHEEPPFQSSTEIGQPSTARVRE